MMIHACIIEDNNNSSMFFRAVKFNWRCSVMYFIHIIINFHALAHRTSMDVMLPFAFVNKKLTVRFSEQKPRSQQSRLQPSGPLEFCLHSRPDVPRIPVFSFASQKSGLRATYIRGFLISTENDDYARQGLIPLILSEVKYEVFPRI